MAMDTSRGSYASASGISTVDISSADYSASTQSRGLMVGVGGDVKVTMSDGSVGVLPALIAGQIYPVQVTKVWKTGTTATTIILLL